MTLTSTVTSLAPSFTLKPTTVVDPLSQVDLNALIQQAEIHIKTLHPSPSSSSSINTKKNSKLNTPFRLHKLNTSIYDTQVPTTTSTSTNSLTTFKKSTHSNNSLTSVSALHGLSDIPTTLPTITPSSLRTTDTIVETAGEKWFDLPATPMTPEIQHDLTLLRSREILDPKRHYKKDKKNAELPKYFQMGTVIAPAHEFYSSRLTKKQRKSTLTEEILADTTTVNRIKQKAIEIQHEKAALAKPRGRTKKLYLQKKRKALFTKKRNQGKS
ncbi:hypothetical protein HMI54_005232 [Coelomomyces lativittatus]|nr:hypothetical protein HMI54_005232 [Coelomomyces lativittatus]